MPYFVFIQRGFPCKAFVTHCTEIRPWLLIMCTLSDIIVSFSVILQRSFTCEIYTTWDIIMNKYIILLSFNTSWGFWLIKWANGVIGRRCIVLHVIAQKLQNDQTWNLMPKHFHVTLTLTFTQKVPNNSFQSKAGRRLSEELATVFFLFPVRVRYFKSFFLVMCCWLRWLPISFWVHKIQTYRIKLYRIVKLTVQ